MNFSGRKFNIDHHIALYASHFNYLNNSACIQNFILFYTNFMKSSNNPLIPGGNKKVTHTSTNLQLNA